MVFEVGGKVALVTGGASGIGLEYAKEILRNKAKGVTLADTDSNFGKQALSQIESKFGNGKAIFVKTDVTNIKEFEDAFKKTIEIFQNVDILINNAGILNDAVWEREISINVNGVVHGMRLGLDNYLQKFRQTPEAVIINISSTCGVEGYPHIPVYCGTKFAVIGMTKSWGSDYHYDRTKVRVAAVCPGVTDTPLISDMAGRNFGGPYEKFVQDHKSSWAAQTPNHVAKEVIKVIKSAPSGSVWIIEGGEKAYEYPIMEREKLTRNYIEG